MCWPPLHELKPRCTFSASEDFHWKVTHYSPAPATSESQSNAAINESLCDCLSYRQPQLAEEGHLEFLSDAGVLTALPIFFVTRMSLVEHNPLINLLA